MGVGDGPGHEFEVVRGGGDKPFVPGNRAIFHELREEEMNRKRVEQLIWKMDSDERFDLINRCDPPDFVPKGGESFLLSIAPNGKRFGDNITDCLKTFRERLTQRRERVGRKSAVVCAMFNDGEMGWSA